MVELLLLQGALLQLPYPPPEGVVFFYQVGILALVDVPQVELVVLSFPVTALVHALLQLCAVRLSIMSRCMNHDLRRFLNLWPREVHRQPVGLLSYANARRRRGDLGVGRSQL